MEKAEKQEIVLKFKNYGKFSEFETSFYGSYLYYIKGKNKVGKTTIMEALINLMRAENNKPDAITRGADKAVVEGKIPGPGGMYTIQMTITPKTTSFIMFTPDDLKVNKVTQIRDVFEYNAITVESFIKKSYTPDGRRDQIKIILELLPDDIKNQYLKNLDLLNPKKSLLWSNRKEAKAELDKAIILLDNIEDPGSKVDLEKELENIDTLFKNASIKHSELPKYTKEDLENKQASINNETLITNNKYDNSYENKINIIRQREIELENLKNELKEIENDKISFNNSQQERLSKLNKLKDALDEDKIQKVIREYNELKEAKSSIESKLLIVDNYQAKKADVKNAQLNYLNASNRIDEVRKANAEILNNSDLSDLNIKIEDDVLYVNDFVFNEHQVADSELILTTVSILAKTLKKGQVLCVGKLAELDNESKEKLYNIGEANNISIIGDEVDSDYDEVFIVGHEKGTTDIPEEIKERSHSDLENASKPTETVIEEDLPQSNNMIDLI